MWKQSFQKRLAPLDAGLQRLSARTRKGTVFEPRSPRDSSTPTVTLVVPKNQQGSSSGDWFRFDAYTKEELDEFREVFCMFDKDRSGAIGYEELEQAMKSLGMEAAQKDIEALIKEVDVDGNGEIDFEEFCLVMKKMTQKKDSEEEIVRTCFQVFDQDEDGVISEKEFIWVFKEVGGFTDKEIEDIFREADVAGNQRLDYHEFSQLVKTYLFDDA